MDSLKQAIAISLNILLIILYVIDLILMPFVDIMELFYANILIWGVLIFAVLAFSLIWWLYDL